MMPLGKEDVAAAVVAGVDAAVVATVENRRRRAATVSCFSYTTSETEASEVTVGAAPGASACT